MNASGTARALSADRALHAGAPAGVRRDTRSTSSSAATPTASRSLIVHGGPGGGCNPTMRRCHDPARYRIVLFDQRGCGRSTPHASLEHNTTWDLVADMERLREHLGIERWQLFGGSWGSTLALAYAETHPERVTGLILRGIFLLRRAELRGSTRKGAAGSSRMRSRRYLAVDPAGRARRHDRGLLQAADASRSRRADRGGQGVEHRGRAATLSLYEDPERVRHFAHETYALAFARIECHYFVNRGFFRCDDQLLADAHRLARHPRRDRARPLRCGDAGQERVGPEAGLAAGGSQDRCRCRATP